MVCTVFVLVYMCNDIQHRGIDQTIWVYYTFNDNQGTRVLQNIQFLEYSRTSINNIIFNSFLCIQWYLKYTTIGISQDTE